MRLVLLALAFVAPQSRDKELWEKLGPLFSPLPEFKNDLGAFRPLLKFATAAMSAAPTTGKPAARRS